MNTRPYLIPANLSTPCWPSGRGEEIGSVFGTFASIATDLSRPFFYDREFVTTFILSKEIGLIAISLELSFTDGWGDFLEEGSEKLIQPTFFAIFIDSQIAADDAQTIIRSSFPKDALIDFHH